MVTHPLSGRELMGEIFATIRNKGNLDPARNGARQAQTHSLVMKDGRLIFEVIRDEWKHQRFLTSQVLQTPVK